MKKITEYIEKAFADIPDSKAAYNFKQKLFDEVTDRANEITHAGISDENVIADLIISEHPDIKGEYNAVVREIRAKKRKKNKMIFRVVGSVLYFLVTLFAFLAVSIITKDWAHTWVFMVSAVLIYISYILFLVIGLLTRRRSMFHPLSRILLAVNVFIYAVVIFLCLAVAFHVTRPWLVFLFAVIAMMAADGIYAEKAAERFAIFFHLLYIVPSAAMIYVILSILGVIPWHPGWLIIPGSLIIVAIVILIRIYKHNKDKELEETEADSEWNAD